MMPALRQRISRWDKASVSNTAAHKNISEIAPEAAELEMYPTDARLRQKAKEKKIKEEAGENINQLNVSRQFCQAQTIVVKTLPLSMR